MVDGDEIDDPLKNGCHSNLVIKDCNIYKKSQPAITKVLTDIVDNHKNSLNKVKLYKCTNLFSPLVLKLHLGLFSDFIQEIVIFNCNLSTSERSKIENIHIKWRNLRSLRIIKSCPDHLLFFENSQVSKLNELMRSILGRQKLSLTAISLI